MTVLDAPPTDAPDDAAQALFEEARRRRRHRRLLALGVSLFVVAGAVVVATATTAHHAPPPRHVITPAKRPAPRTKPAVVATGLRSAHGLTVGPDGTLYVVDTSRDEVMRRLPDGTFGAVAGNGQRGFSGDGGPATQAALNLSGYSGVAVAPNGTVYIADSGNDRVRAVSSNGTITTVAGNGGNGMLLSSGPALTTPIGPVAGLTMGPDGDLYLAASNVLRLTPSGTLEWVAGNRTSFSSSPCQFGECSPVGESNFIEPDQLAFDGAGNLYVSGGGGFQLFEITTQGSLLFLQQFRGDGAPGALATDPEGSVIEAWRDGVNVRSPAGVTSDVPGTAGSALNETLGLERDPQQRAIPNEFIAGDGVAVGPNGDVYLDTNVGNSFTTESELVRLRPSGQATILWNSSSPSS
jgi:sugar lactone lactonase YvrE